MEVEQKDTHKEEMEWEDLPSVSWSQQEQNRDKARRLGVRWRRSWTNQLQLSY